MSAATNPPQDDDDMPAEIDFSGATRGKFYWPNLKLNLPVYLDAEVQAYLANDLLKREIAIIEAAYLARSGRWVGHFNFYF